MTMHDRNVGLQSLMLAGCQVTTIQSLIFELLRDSKHKDFKTILKDVVMNDPVNDRNEKQTLDMFYSAPAEPK